MEIIKDNKNAAPDVRRTAYIFGGALMIALGLVWLCYNYNLLPRGVYDVIFSWQMAVVLAGGWLLANQRWAIGAVVTCVGLLGGLIDALDIYISFTKLILPLALIALGVACIFVKPTKAGQS